MRPVMLCATVIPKVILALGMLSHYDDVHGADVLCVELLIKVITLMKRWMVYGNLYGAMSTCDIT